MIFRHPIDHVCFALREPQEASIFGSDVQFEELHAQGVLVAAIPSYSYFIELITPTSNEAVLRYVNSRQTPAFHHLCLCIESFSNFKQENNISYVYSIPQPGFKNKLINFFKLGSVLFEVCKSLDHLVENKRVIVSESPPHDQEWLWIFPKWNSDRERDFDGSLNSLMVPFFDWGYSETEIKSFLSFLKAKEIRLI